MSKLSFNICTLIYAGLYNNKSIMFLQSHELLRLPVFMDIT